MLKVDCNRNKQLEMNQIHLNESPVKFCQNSDDSGFITDQVYNCMMVKGRTHMVYIETRIQRVFTNLLEESSFFESVVCERSLVLGLVAVIIGDEFWGDDELEF